MPPLGGTRAPAEHRAERLPARRPCQNYDPGLTGPTWGICASKLRRGKVKCEQSVPRHLFSTAGPHCCLALEAGPAALGLQALSPEPVFSLTFLRPRSWKSQDANPSMGRRLGSYSYLVYLFSLFGPAGLS